MVTGLLSDPARAKRVSLERTLDQRQAFEALYREMFPLVHTYCTARLGKNDGEDVTADTFHAAARAFQRGDHEKVTPAWLMAVARNKVIDRWRKHGRRKALAHLVQPLESDLVTLPDSWNVDPRRQQVLETLESMKLRHRTLLILHHVDGMSVAELAAATNTSTTAVESALARARRAFRKNYGKVVA